jgi:hydroxypyruvate isomerase
MPKLAASVSSMFREAELLDRFALAAAAGFRAVEIQAPYQETPEAIAERVRRADLAVVLINTPVGLAAVPGEERAFRMGLTTALEYATALRCGQVHCLAGQTDNPDAERTFVANLRWAADEAASQGVRLLLEPLNTVDNPGYFLTSTAQARGIIDQVARDNVRMQYDCYHMQIMEGRLADTIRAQLDMIGHFQISGVPGRHEPDAQQEINYPYVLSLIDALGFAGWVGCEYLPRAGTLEGLDWARPYGVTSTETQAREGTT